MFVYFILFYFLFSNRCSLWRQNLLSQLTLSNSHLCASPSLKTSQIHSLKLSSLCLTVALQVTLNKPCEKKRKKRNFLIWNHPKKMKPIKLSPLSLSFFNPLFGFRENQKENIICFCVNGIGNNLLNKIKKIIITEAFREIAEILCLYTLIGCWENEGKENRKLVCVSENLSLISLLVSVAFFKVSGEILEILFPYSLFVSWENEGKWIKSYCVSEI